MKRSSFRICEWIAATPLTAEDPTMARWAMLMSLTPGAHGFSQRMPYLSSASSVAAQTGSTAGPDSSSSEDSDEEEEEEAEEEVADADADAAVAVFFSPSFFFSFFGGGGGGGLAAR